MSYRGIISLMPKTPPFDVDALAFISATGITDNTQKSAVNTLVVDLKANSLWTKMKAIYPFVGGTATTHKFNLKDPRDLDAAFRMSFVGGVAHDSNGIIPNGINAQGNTHILATSMGTTSLSTWYYSRDDVNNTKAIYGTGNNYYLIVNKTIPINYAALNSTGTSTAIIPSRTDGLLGTNRTSNADLKIFRNGVSYVTIGAVTPNSEAYPIAFFWHGEIGNYTTVKCSFGAVGEGLNDSEALIFYNIIQNYQTTLSRQV